MLCCCAPRPSPQLAWLRQLRRLQVRVAARCQLARLTLGPPPRRLQQYSSPDCAKGSESGNPFAPPGGSAEDAKRPQSATLAFGVCFKDRKAPPRPCEPRGAPLAALALAQRGSRASDRPECFGRAARVANMNDDPKTKFDEHHIYNFLPKYMKLECNADGTVTKLTYNDAQCSGPEVDDQTVTTQLIQAMVRAARLCRSSHWLPGSPCARAC